MKRAILISVVLALAAAGWTAYDLYRPFRGYAGNLFLTLEPGTPALETARRLVDRGVLASRWPFLVCYTLGRPRRSLKAGEYLFDRPLRPIDVYRKLIHGDVYLHTVVIPEGSDRFDMARILSQRLGISPQDFLRASQRAEAIQDLDPGAASLEGFLFPDTYRFPRSANAPTVIAAMLGRFRRVWETPAGAGDPLPHANLREVLTLASLVEKETPSPEERPLIAGVFTNRLAKRMPLQCDPTVIYAARLDGRPIGLIQQSDLQFDSPYNTYRYAGLPPGPIASPGEASIRAALHPAATPYLYFVSNLHGGHIFARTLAEHQKNVARYRREVAVLRQTDRAASAGFGRTNPGSLQLGNQGVKAKSNQGAEKAEQETAHPRALARERPRARRGARDSRPPEGAARAPRS